MVIRAILFDWRGTLVCTPTSEDWILDALRRIDRDPANANEIRHQIIAANGPGNRLDAPGVDTDQVVHRAVFMSVFADAGLDAELSNALYESESDPFRNDFANDAGPTIRSLYAAGLRIGIVSDIHFDIRPAFNAAGLAPFISSYSLSFEVGTQKPGKAIYQHALDELAVPPEEALMVGDRSVPDGGAVEHGIPAILPPLRSRGDERLSLVLAAAGCAI